MSAPVTVSPLQHAILRVLAAVREIGSTDIHHTLAPDWPDVRRSDVTEALGQLEVARLVRINDDRQWSATGLGQATALGVGPANRQRSVKAPTAHELLAMATPARPRTSMGTGDLRPPVLRPGAEVALQLPSRVGGQRRWPDGRRDTV